MFDLNRYGQIAGKLEVEARVAAERRHLVRTLFGGGEGRDVIERIDPRIDALPGLDGLGLMDGTLRRYR